MRVYLAGPMKGVKELNYPRFFEVAETLRSMCDVVNPATHPGPTYDDFIEQGLWSLDECDVMVLLENWEDSYGTSLELKRAAELGISVYTLEEFITMMSFI